MGEFQPIYWLWCWPSWCSLFGGKKIPEVMRAWAKASAFFKKGHHGAGQGPSIAQVSPLRCARADSAARKEVFSKGDLRSIRACVTGRGPRYRPSCLRFLFVSPIPCRDTHRALANGTPRR